ncbi:amidase [Mycolicibacterium vaccae]|uniref:amidase n=1 Tax=Mycolicibacterium vaccae TaxID=1810 RepID=UPI003CF9B6A0
MVKAVNECVHTRSIAEQVSEVQSRSTSACDIAAEVRRDIQAVEERIRAWVALSPAVGQEARAVDEAVGTGASLPLAGICLGVKDIIDVAGLPTRAGSALTRPGPATADAGCVARLRSLGTVVQGKTVTTEFAYLQPGPTRNPHAPEHTPGGSSSGSAAAVGAGTIPLALGSQTAGSLTRPAAYCGTAGMVFPPGSVDMSGIIGLSPSLDTLGLLTRTVADLEYVYAAFTACAGVQKGTVLRGVQIWDGDGLVGLTPEMSELMAAVPRLLDEIGVSSEPLGWREQVRLLTESHLDVMAYEALRERAQEYTDHPRELSAPLSELLRTGEGVSEEQYVSVLQYRDEARVELSALLEQSPVIVGPATPGPAPFGIGATGISVMSRAWQLLGLPVVVVPGARTRSGLPLGLQIIGLPGAEPLMLDLGRRLEWVLRSRTPGC